MCRFELMVEKMSLLESLFPSFFNPFFHLGEVKLDELAGVGTVESREHP